MGEGPACDDPPPRPLQAPAAASENGLSTRRRRALPGWRQRTSHTRESGSTWWPTVCIIRATNGGAPASQGVSDNYGPHNLRPLALGGSELVVPRALATFSREQPGVLDAPVGEAHAWLGKATRRLPRSQGFCRRAPDALAHPASARCFGFHNYGAERLLGRHSNLDSLVRRVIIATLIAVILAASVLAVFRERSIDNRQGSQRYFLRHSAMTLVAKSSTSVAHSYQGGSQSFVSQLNSGQVSSVVVNTTAQTIQVTPKSGPPTPSAIPTPHSSRSCWPSTPRSPSQPRAVARRGAAC